MTFVIKSTYSMTIVKTAGTTVSSLPKVVGLSTPMLPNTSTRQPFNHKINLTSKE